MTHDRIADNMIRFNQAKRVKFLEQLRKMVAGGDNTKKISDFDVIRFVCEHPVEVEKLSELIGAE